MVARDEEGEAQWSLNALAQAAKEAGIAVKRSQIRTILVREGVRWRHTHSWGTAHDKDFRIPRIDWDRTTKEVLTLEWIDGTPLSDIKALASKGYDLQDLARSVVQSFLRTAMRDRFIPASAAG